MKKDLLTGLTHEQIEKAKACKNDDELLALAKAEGIALTDEQLSAVTGGGITCLSTPTMPCPKCGSQNIHRYHGATRWFNECRDCDYEWMC